MNPTPEQVKTAVDNCNEAIHSIDTDIGELDIIDELRNYSKQLAEIWQTENGENITNELNSAIDTLKTYTDSLKQSMDNIKKDTYTFKEVRYQKGSGRI